MVLYSGKPSQSSILGRSSVKQKGFYLLIAVIAGILFSSELRSADQNQFLRFTAELSSNGVRLIETRIAFGLVKAGRLPVRENSNRYVVRVYGIGSKVLFEDSFRDPRTIHYDTLDFEGKLTGGVVVLEKAAFSVKLPLTNTAQRIDFFERYVAGPEDSESFTTSGEKRIGSFTLQEVRNALVQR